MTLIDILIIAALAGVVIPLGFGLYTLYRGDEAARSRSNKLMRLRVAVQAVAVVLLVVGMAIKHSQAG